MTRFALALACVLGTLGSAHADPVLRPVGEGCSRNSDCPDDKVCYPGTRGGGQCLPECSLDKDCATGFACSSAGACVASWGGLFGRIEIEPGLSAAACKAVLDGKSVDCDANGSFVFERAGAGKRVVRITVAGYVQRTLSMWVNPGIFNDAGTILVRSSSLEAVRPPTAEPVVIPGASPRLSPVGR
jgi:hypothetical protein